MPSNRKLEQQSDFAKNITRLVEFANANGFCLIYDIPHMDTGCEYGRALYSDSLSISFKLFRRTPGGRLDYMNLVEDHALLKKFWKSLDTRCTYENRTYSMPFTSPDT